MAAVVVAKATTGTFGRQTWNQLPRISGCIVVQRRDSSNVPTSLTAMKRGTGGRSSFSGIVATVFGATGLLGRLVCNRLGKIGSQVIIPYRCDAYEVEPLRLVGDLGQVLFFPFNLRDEEAIRKTVQYSNVVINLVGRDYETKNFTFKDVHVTGARRLARIAKECGVEKFIHMSHLNAKEEPQKIWKTSQYLVTKYESELAVREEFPEAIIFKSADMFGEGDRFLFHFAQRSRWGTFTGAMPLWKKGEQTIKQPVYLSNVAEGIVAAIRNPDVVGKTIECVGPQRYYLSDIVDHIFEVLRRDDVIWRSRFTLPLRLKAKIFDMNPMTPWFCEDKIEREGVTDWPTPGALTLEDLGVSLTPLEDMTKFLLFPRRRFAYYSDRMGDTFFQPNPMKPAEFYQPKPQRPGVVEC